MWERLFNLDFRRKRLLKRAPAGPLRDYLSVPFPDPRTPYHEVPFIAVDLETTGLDPRQDELLSIGLVELAGTRIDLDSARRKLVRPERAIPEASAVVHRITDDHAAHGVVPAEALVWLLERLAGKVMIAHHAAMEKGFIGSACERLLGGRFLIPVVDTQWLARRTLDRQGRAYRAEELRLARLRERYNLPRYRCHDALSDALAAAELFAAQVAERGGQTPLKELLSPN
ncbi:exonuclease domain-containing protein [Endothiovibrio diazotrophicus]